MQPKESARQAVSDRLRAAREAAGLSQAQVAAQLNMHRPSVSEIEAARRKVSAEELAAFASLYSVSVGWLVGERPDSADVEDPRLALAARQMARLRPVDLDQLLRLIASLPRDASKWKME
jgi:transcriptional regulator with XRE-family HTH domain